jgi:hypothetical protein
MRLPLYATGGFKSKNRLTDLIIAVDCRTGACDENIFFINRTAQAVCFSADTCFERELFISDFLIVLKEPGLERPGELLIVPFKKSETSLSESDC